MSTPTGRSPSHAPTSAASPGRRRSSRREPPALAQLDDARRLDARQVVARFGDIGRDHEDGCRERVVVERREPVVGGERLGVVRAERGARVERLRHPLVPCERRCARRPDAAAARSRTRPRSLRGRRSRPATRRRGAANSGVPGSVPPSRIHSSAYDSGSSVSRSTTQASSGIADASTHARTRSSPDSPSRLSQLPSSCATPPGARCAPTPEMKAATRSSPCIPPSRYSYAGHTGDPRRDDERRIRDHPVELLALDRMRTATRAASRMPVDAVEQRVQAREPQRRSPRRRSRRPRATSRRARRAWMPHPAPTSSAARDRRRQLQRGEGEGGAAHAEHVVLGKCAAECRLIEVARDPPLARSAVVGERLRADDRPRQTDRRPRRARPEPGEPIGARCAASADSDGCCGLRHPEHEESTEHGQRVERGRRAPGRRGRAVPGRSRCRPCRPTRRAAPRR